MCTLSCYLTEKENECRRMAYAKGETPAGIEWAQAALVIQRANMAHAERCALCRRGQMAVVHEQDYGQRCQ